jgi:prepilin-type N-terminal cleavage/methylation domain-containing protein
MVKGLNSNILKNQNGFTLVEVMIAFTIFAVFISVFLMSQGTNISNSVIMMEDITLHNLAESKMNEIILNPPTFTNGLENDKKSKNFEEEDYKKYKYTIEYKKLEIPNLSELMGQTDEEDDPAAESKNNAIKKMVFKKLKKNMELILWQVKVTTTNTETAYAYELTSWITNSEAKLDTNFGF